MPVLFHVNQLDADMSVTVSESAFSVDANSFLLDGNIFFNVFPTNVEILFCANHEKN